MMTMALRALRPPAQSPHLPRPSLALAPAAHPNQGCWAAAAPLWAQRPRWNLTRCSRTTHPFPNLTLGMTPWTTCWALAVAGELSGEGIADGGGLSQQLCVWFSSGLALMAHACHCLLGCRQRLPVCSMCGRLASRHVRASTSKRPGIPPKCMVRPLVVVRSPLLPRQGPDAGQQGQQCLTLSLNRSRHLRRWRLPTIPRLRLRPPHCAPSLRVCPGMGPATPEAQSRSAHHSVMGNSEGRPTFASPTCPTSCPTRNPKEVMVPQAHVLPLRVACAGDGSDVVRAASAMGGAGVQGRQHATCTRSAVP